MTRPLESCIGIVDDDGAVRDSLRLLLESHGFRVEAFESAVAFLASGRTGHDCLVIDLHMPEMTGLEMIEALRLNGNAVPAIMISGRMDPRLVKRASDAKILTILTKPFVDRQLLEWIDRALGASPTD